MKRETFVCKCGREVGVVRLNAATLTFGHRINPRNERHPVQLARSGENDALANPRQSTTAIRSSRSRRSRELATRREDAPNASPSTDPALAVSRPRARGVRAGS